MNRFIKTFVDNSARDVADRANEYAEAEKLVIVSAQLTFADAGHTYEKAVLVVVYESEKPPRKPRKKTEGVADGSSD